MNMGAKLTCQESFGNNLIKSLVINNIGDMDAFNIRLFIANDYIQFEKNGLFPFPKIEAGRKIEVQYMHNLLYDSSEIPPYVELKFNYADENSEKEYLFYMTT